MSKLANLRKVTKKLKGQKLKRIMAIIRDYGFSELLRKVKQKMQFGDTFVDIDQHLSLITNESFLKKTDSRADYHPEKEVCFMARPLGFNIGRVDIFTQNPSGTGSITMTIRSAKGRVRAVKTVHIVKHNDYTSFEFLPIFEPLKRTSYRPAYFTFTSDTDGCGVLVNRRKNKRGFEVKGGGSVICKIYMQRNAEYIHWRRNNDPSAEQLDAQRVRSFSFSPKISIIVPLYNTPPRYLRDMIESVIAQTYPNWELCLADGSETIDLKEITDSYNDNRIVYKKLERNDGISDNSNEALKMATGEYAALLDHDDTLAPHALYANVELLNKDRDYEFIYSDEDKLSEDGSRRFDPFFKPDFSPDMLRAFNYITHFVVFKKSLLDEVGYFRKEYNGAQDYDLTLRLTEKAKKIGHISDILYHWRLSAGSTAYSSDAKSYTIEAGRSAVEESLRRMGITNAHVVNNQLDNYYITSYDIPTPHPLISIIIPNKDEKRTLKKCIDSIVSKSTYDRYEIIIVENNSVKKSTFSYYEALQKNPNIRVVEWNHPFNYSALNNFAAAQAKGELLLFMNNDMSVISPDWLEQMAMHALRPEIGQVGAKLYYPDDTIQHGGVILRIGPVAGHSHKSMNRYDVGSFARMILAHNVSAVTAACMMMRAEVFHEVNGFDEQFTVALNDVDLSLKVREKGYFILWTPFAELYHYESKTRGYEETPEKKKRLKAEQQKWLAKWEEKYPYDPFYNKNLSNRREDYSVNPHKLRK